MSASEGRQDALNKVKSLEYHLENGLKNPEVKASSLVRTISSR
jgi:hypothetical protein